MKFISRKNSNLQAGKTFSILSALLLGMLAMGSWSSLHAAGETWDANTTSGGVQDGTGTWSTTNVQFLSTGTAVDQAWVNGDDALLGGSAASSGTSMLVILGSNITVNNLAFGNIQNGGGGWAIRNNSPNTFTLTITGSMSNANGNGDLRRFDRAGPEHREFLEHDLEL